MPRLIVGDRVAAHLVPWAGVELAQRDAARPSFGRGSSTDGRAWAAEAVAKKFDGPHDLVLLAVPKGTGAEVLANVARGLEAPSVG